ncbi:MAG TPA: hypothetical protein VH229_06590 [Candidatus Udaeobacter sp.]|nr:hypothetical protein [Candidatus Udaeobacter sp.]
MSILSPPQDGFAVANLGHRPRVRQNPKPPALKARFSFEEGSREPLDLIRAFSAGGLLDIGFLGRWPQADMTTRRWR